MAVIGVFAIAHAVIDMVFFGLFIGPGLLFLGVIVKNASCLAQAVIASGYYHFIASVLLATTASNFFDQLRAGILLVTGTITITLAAVHNSFVKRVMNGMIAGYTMLSPLINPRSGVVAHLLFTQVAGCNRLGDPTVDFTKGTPVCEGADCTSCLSGEQFHEKHFLMVYYGLQTVHWGATFYCGKRSLGNPELLRAVLQCHARGAADGHQLHGCYVHERDHRRP